MVKKKGFWIRLAASAVDLILGLILGLLLSKNIGFFFARLAVVMLKIGSPESIWKGPLPMIMGIFSTFFYVLPFSILLVLVIEGFSGASPGKFLFGMRVREKEGAAAAPKTLLFRSIIKTSGLWGMTISLLIGSWIAAIFSLAAICLILIGFFWVLGNSKMALHDRISGSGVYSLQSPISKRLA